MAVYTITTTRQQEIGVNHMFTYYNPAAYPDKQSFVQAAVKGNFDMMFQTYVRDSSVALDKSLATIPEANRPAAQADIEQTITDAGGTIVRVGDVVPPPIPGVPATQVPQPSSGDVDESESESSDPSST